MKCEEEEIDCMQAPTSCNKAFKLCPKEEVKLLAFLYPDVTPISSTCVEKNLLER